jgi:hypothetical protein|tara:strand:+ start:1150 stop:1410 length:261 start_codon:yes stop_codon:yes gene_type:complete
MGYKNQVDLLNEQLGKKGQNVCFTTAAQTEDFYAVHFVTESVIASITIANGTGESALQTTIPAGTVIFANITAITLTSGVAIGYHN